ncbi:acyl-CoA synthetase (AMP-forming)/AMP-acid ligase II [Desulfosporosinus orientis DSM 765]|uniref:Acyl-CoA synthetase (AMP-forming)/AMP-acid ligase II n=1 Tax=Desulfosporosinus orientis (strain ATCC 19365 / DSM 765 / NCIMB 8382 / VKM B-1628 / Singapore I) TaxID=768706 RepID=G7WCL8_DESOD|nr:long-chain fatty acid--CoA ligase [Desulfosporosinus orientis]AET66556.1 acyl-CoA synthetase (AMP-forming)/AMP-acid ligase II [Desulfosporosinus orientis DSM 765]
MNNKKKLWLNSYPQGIRYHINYPYKSLGQILDETVDKMPDALAMIFSDQRVTYRQFGDQVNRFAGALADIGIVKGDRVGLMGPNCPQWEIAFYALLKLGAIVVQTNPMYIEREIAYQMNDSGATTIIVLEMLYPRVKNIVEETSLQRVIVFNFLAPVQPSEGLFSYDELIKHDPVYPNVAINPIDDLAVLQYTGGTTGVSKGVMLTHYNLIANTLQVLEWDAKTQYGKERILTILPIFHVYGMTDCMNYAVTIAATQIILPRFDVDQVLETIRVHKPTFFPGAPTMFMAINSHPRVAEYRESLVAIRSCTSGSAPLPLEVAQKFAKVTHGEGNLVEGYGLSEGSPVTHCNPLDRPSLNGSIGLPLPDTDYVIMDLETGDWEVPVGEIGELCIRGPQVMKGYWEKPIETAETLRNGWLHTGDIGRMDEDGFCYIIDRKKDIIIAGGFNIYPRDIEEVLYEHPKVKEVVVAGVPDLYRGETVKAYIVLQPNTEANENEFIVYCKTKMAAFKVPRHVEFRDELPRTIVGKVLRRKLVEEEKAKIQTAATTES